MVPGHVRNRMFKLIAFCVLLGGLPAFAAVEVRADTVLQINYDSVKESASPFIWNEMKKSDVTGLSIALVDNQRLVWAQGFGYANLRKEIAATPDTVYRIGSLTKVFTALAAMQLSEQGKLNIDAPLKSLLPEFSVRTRFETGVPISIRDLLTHHSGLPSDFQKGMWSRNPEPFTTVTRLIKDEYTAYPPGFIFSYSNIGYDLLGHVIERASGQDYVQFIRNSQLKPLGMRYSGFTPPAAISLLSAGYSRGKEMDDPPLRDLPAGGMYSTVLDLSRFMKMLFANGTLDNQQIIKPGTLAAMFRPQNENVPLDLGLRVGLGWMLGGLGEVEILNAGTVAHKVGATMMFRSAMVVLPKYKLGVVVLSNSSTSGRMVSKVAVQALTLALEKKTGIKQPLQETLQETDLPLPPDVRHTYVGNYASMVGLAEITSKSDRFNLDALNRTFHLIPHASGKFGVKYALLGLFPFSLAELDDYEVSYSHVAGREILRATTKGSDLLIAEKIRPVPVSKAWQMRVGSYQIENLGDDFLLLSKIAIRFDKSLLIAECSLPFFFKSTFRFPLRPVSDTEVVLAGLGGRSMGETIRVITVNGKEKLLYSGYVLGREQ